MSKIIAGIDEAGRGPVLGPLVMVAIAVKEEDVKKLEWLGVKDSKLLSSQVREELFERIHEIAHNFRVEVIEPDAIDLSLTEESSNLNWLEAETSARLVSELNPDKIIVDCPSINIPAYTEYFANKLSEGVRSNAELVVEHKADMNYIVVAAASVVAKVIRDRYIEKIKAEIGVDFGSGYMSDPKTKEFLDTYHEKYPHLFRRKWKSYETAVVKKAQKSLGEF
ncbi:ribonuclease HII [Candidatus Woesearchaeota archaeon]|jgi:ribonuclease HII|nr:ribonuclease HII [Candidatus Woesearchaeota archaeon]MBT5396600.1 ribonuclease HII [Candidatus Woesearchaeota archaeon]MBT6367994.1 ribonuclease HII [Candidatus Woesearchaeota archaeon]MBT7762234.1 ribonuclease HII [Candidatus Woesearchaeota archaeon]